ncbi:heme uptake protein IsdC [Paenibacillus daejeonensis]|uniref:heme uptake protein IsdC n=1 Tax=Paenibacillus daejeonensis TaxID=135193 RepID=UPI0003769920|nr:heme uptake protein IsdC [Paenibacillus daejeonensis]
MKHKLRRVSLLLTGLVLSLLWAGLIHAQSLDNGVYTVDYTVLKAENDSASMANDYWEKPAKLTVQDGKVTIQMTVNHSQWVTEFKVPAGGNYVDTKVISTDTGADKRTVEFTAAGIEQPILSKIHVTVAEIDYDHDYTIRFAFKPDSLKLIQAAESAATPEPPVDKPTTEKPPAATEQPAAAKPSKPAATPSSSGTPAANTTASSPPPAAQPTPPKKEASSSSQEPAAGSGQESTNPPEAEAREIQADEPVVEAEENPAVEPVEEPAASEIDNSTVDEEAASTEQPAEATAVTADATDETTVVEEGRQLSAAPASGSSSSGQAKTWLIISIAVVGAGIIAAGVFLIYRRRVEARQA